MTTVRNAFWVLALFVIGLYAFFVALGAWAPGEVLPVTIAICALAVLWVVHAWFASRSRAERDRRLASARERRGF